MEESPEEESPEGGMTSDQIRQLLENLGRPRRFGPHFGDLVEAIEWELQAQLAIGRIGEVNPTDEQRHNLAVLIADEVDWRFRLEPRTPPGQD